MTLPGVDDSEKRRTHQRGHKEAPHLGGLPHRVDARRPRPGPRHSSPLPGTHPQVPLHRKGRRGRSIKEWGEQGRFDVRSPVSSTGPRWFEQLHRRASTSIRPVQRVPLREIRGSWAPSGDVRLSPRPPAIPEWLTAPVADRADRRWSPRGDARAGRRRDRRVRAPETLRPSAR